MIKKITAGVATLALSFGIISTASAAEFTQPSSPIKESIQVNASNISTLSAARYYATKINYIEKGKSIPDSYFMTAESNGAKYGGSIPIQKVEDSGSFWKVTYAGYLNRFFE
ncbi:hypothetical protein JDS91_30065 [Bacillus cereus]|uniref:hypothetical protein n=1 Tax=Bacillus cereus TaxID=1396 RepID=UPI0018F64973|nr:hypothetical protein [Bacillus cereus]